MDPERHSQLLPRWFQSIFAEDSTISTPVTSSTSSPATSSLSNAGWRSQRLKGSKVLRFATMKSSKDRDRQRFAVGQMVGWQMVGLADGFWLGCGGEKL